MKNAIIQSSIANLVFMIFLWSLALFFVVPGIIEMSDKKRKLREVVSEYETITREGISFLDLRRLSSQLQTQGWEYTSSVLKNINAQYYDDIFYSTWSQSFSEILENKRQETLDMKSSQEYQDKERVISKIIPVYTKDENLSQSRISDFHFVNYVENIMFTFNLSSQWEVWMWAIERVTNELEVELGEEETDSLIRNSLEENIFRIPLKFEVVWQKSDVIDFIHFFENVGSVSVNGNDLEIYSDAFISKALTWQSPIGKYNIYENQVADIAFLGLKNYPDSSPISNSQWLISTMKTDQGDEKINLELQINFYVAGVPGYRMDMYINNFLERYTELVSQISLDARKYSTQAGQFKRGGEIQAIQQLQSINLLILSQKDEIQQLRIWFAKREDLESTYDESIKFSKLLDWIESDYKKQIDILTKK